MSRYEPKSLNHAAPSGARLITCSNSPAPPTFSDNPATPAPNDGSMATRSHSVSNHTRFTSTSDLSKQSTPNLMPEVSYPDQLPTPFRTTIQHQTPPADTACKVNVRARRGLGSGRQVRSEQGDSDGVRAAGSDA